MKVIQHDGLFSCHMEDEIATYRTKHSWWKALAHPTDPKSRCYGEIRGSGWTVTFSSRPVKRGQR